MKAKNKFFLSQKSKGLFLLNCMLYSLLTFSFAQQIPAGEGKMDSLFLLLKTNKTDSAKVACLNQISREFFLVGAYDSSVAYATHALDLSCRINPAFKKGTADAYGNLGNVKNWQGNYPKALDFFFKALKLDEETGNKNGMARRLGNIGIVYEEQGDYQKALDYYLKALKKDEELGNKAGIARHLGNIGILFDDQGDYIRALDYYQQALKLDEELGNKEGISFRLGNIGNVYKEQAEAKENSNHKVIREQLYNQALGFYFKALKLREENGAKNLIASTLANIGSLYAETNRHSDAEKYLLQALTYAHAIGDHNNERQINELLSDLSIKTNRYQQALDYFKTAMALKDTLFNEEKNKEITRKEMQYEFDKKEAASKAEQDKQAAVSFADKQRQRIVLLLVSFVLLLVLIFAGFIFRALRVTRRQKRMIEDQKKMVEEKQKEILDSIHYARRIQTALLPTDRYIDKTLKRLIKH